MNSGKTLISSGSGMRSIVPYMERGYVRNCCRGTGKQEPQNGRRKDSGRIAPGARAVGRGDFESGAPGARTRSASWPPAVMDGGSEEARKACRQQEQSWLQG